MTVVPSEATSETGGGNQPSDVTVSGQQGSVPSAVEAGSAGAGADRVPGGNATVGLLGLLTAALGATLIGLAWAGRYQRTH